MKKKLLIILSVLLLVSSLMFVGCLGETEEKGTGKYWKIDTERTEFVFETGETFSIPFAYIVDSIEDRVDGIKITYNVYNANGDLIRVKRETVTFPMRAGICKIIYSAEGLEDYVINCNVCETLYSPSTFELSGNTLTWNEVEGNVSGKYAISVNGGEEVVVDAASYTTDVFADKGWYAQVKSIGDRITTLDSIYAVYHNRNELLQGQLAEFNEINY